MRSRRPCAPSREAIRDNGLNMLNTLIEMLVRYASPEQVAWLYRNAPQRICRTVALHRFRRTVRWAAKYSSFYARVFAERGIDPRRVRTPADLGDFYTTQDDVAQHAEDFVCRAPSIVFESSGTSGKNKRVYYDQKELVEMGIEMAAGFRLMGVGPDDRVANAFDFSMWIPGLVTHYGLMAAGNFCMAFGKVDPIEVYRRLDQYGITVVLGEPTWLIRLTELAEKHGRKKLRMLIGSAEEMPAKAIPWIKDVWQGASVKMCYGSVEQGTAIGFQPCDVSEGYHVDTFNFVPELIEQDEHGYGELVFTTLMRRVMPLIRYRTRDVTRFVPKPCACGISAPRITKLRGRRDELVVASGGNLYPMMFENVLKLVHGVTHDWQVVFYLQGVKEILELNVESSRTDMQTLRQEIVHQMEQLYPNLVKNLALGIFELRIDVHEPGTLRKKRKLKRLIDRRHFDPVRIETDESAAPLVDQLI